LLLFQTDGGGGGGLITKSGFQKGDLLERGLKREGGEIICSD